MDIPPHIKRLLLETTPRETRLRAAEGLIPLEPHELVLALFFLSGDKDPEISVSAGRSFSNLPKDTVMNALNANLEPRVLRKVIEVYGDDDAVMMMVVLSDNIDDATMVHIASRASEEVLRIIANDGRRMVSNPALLSALKDNPNFTEHMEQISDLLHLSGGKTTDDGGEDKMPSLGSELAEDADATPEKKKGNIYRKIQGMNVGPKIKLALLGNKEARDLLIKDPNTMISSAVLKNPRITDEEVLKVVKSTAASDSVLRLVARNKGFLKNYSIKLGLVMNPKTPLAISMRLIKDLRAKDIKDLSRSKNVPSAISSTAKKMSERKK